MKETMYRMILFLMVMVFCFISSAIRKRLNRWIRGCDDRCQSCAFQCEEKGEGLSVER